MRVRFVRATVADPAVRRRRSPTTQHRPVFAASTRVGRRADRHVRAPARRSTFARRASTTGSPRALRVTPRIVHRGAARRAHGSTGASAMRLGRRHRPARGGGLVDLPHDIDASQRGEPAGDAARHERRQRSSPRSPGPAALGRRPARFLHLDLTLARDRLQAALLRLGRSATSGRSCGRCCSSASSTSSSREIVGVGDGVEHYPRRAARWHRALHFFTRGDRRRRRARSSTARTSCARSRSRAWSIPLVGRAHRALQPGAEPRRRLVFLLALNGVAPRWTWLGSSRSIVLLGVLAPASAMLLSALYVRFRDIKPIWEVILQALFYATPILYPIDARAGEVRALRPRDDGQPARGAHPGDAPPAAREATRRRRPPRSAARCYLLIPAAILVIVTILGFVVFERTAPHAAEELGSGRRPRP